MIPAAVIDALRPVTGELHATAAASGGGCINETVRVAGTDGRCWFLKLNRADFSDVFAAEAEGLEELRRANALRVPRVHACGVAGEHAYLLLDDLELTGQADSEVAAKLGEGLARQHRFTAERYGWHRDNHIGATPQPNGWCDDWITFFRDRRLKFQLELAVRNGYASVVQPDGERVLENIEPFFTGYTPMPSLLHGDLWGGNWGVTATGEPVIFDPAVYYGDREADLAMTR
ncbi:MAG TPA: fructosamine kinase family protein, partial [Chromatiales bacterium]|nr:fructosamine kinase family protein [Chromatiales bacterium]